MDERNIKRAQKWEEKDDTELCLAFCKDGERQVGTGRIGNRRISKYIDTFVGIRSVIGRPVSYAIKDIKNFEDAVLKLQEGKINKKAGSATKDKLVYSTAYRKDMIKSLGRFYCFKHLNQRTLEFAPPEIKRLTRYTIKNSERMIPKEVIEEKELNEMTEACKGNTLPLAILSTLFYSGLRIGEFLTMRIQDVQTDGADTTIFVNQGKTGQRKIPVIVPLPDLVHWADYRSKHSKQNDLLWISPKTKQPLCGASIAKRIRLIVKGVNEARKTKGISSFRKKINPHNWRHSCATLLSVKYRFNEEQLRAYMGWSKTSTMPSVYVRMGYEQLKQVVDGLKKPLKCPNCDTNNPPYATRCSNPDCNWDLTKPKPTTTILNLQKEMEKQDRKMEEIQEKMKKQQEILSRFVSGDLKVKTGK